MTENAEKKPVIWSTFFEQKKSLEKLISDSRADAGFYILLTASSFIASLGFLINNEIALIGGMLVAPLLFPILSLSMGVTTSNIDSITRALKTLLKSALLVIFVSFIISFLMKGGGDNKELLFQMKPNLVFLLIAFTAGVAASYAWVKQNMSAALPGVAVSVTLIPPLSAAGVGFQLGAFDIVGDSLMLFIINIFGIAVAGLIVFSLFGFSKLQKEEDELIKKEETEDLIFVREKIQKEKEKLEEVEKKIIEKEIK